MHGTILICYNFMPLGYTYGNLTCFLGQQSISQRQAPYGPHKVVSGTTYA